MTQRRYKASAPGNIMLFGEHAVLHGRRAVAAAIDQRISVELKPREDGEIRIASAMGSHTTTLSALEDSPRLRFVMRAIRNMSGVLERGFDLRIKSQFSDSLGLGSSAAVTAATMAVLRSLAGMECSPATLHAEALQAVRDVQGCASGADLAASVFGGVVAYRDRPREIEPLLPACSLSIIYCGYKTPTAEVIRQVEGRRKALPFLYGEIFDVMNSVTESAVVALRGNDLRRAGELMNVAHGLMSAIGVSNGDLEHIVHKLRGAPGIAGAKISGSGMGDCVVGMGEMPGGGSVPAGESGAMRIQARIDPRGVIIYD